MWKKWLSALYTSSFNHTHTHCCCAEDEVLFNWTISAALKLLYIVEWSKVATNDYYGN